MAHTVPGFVHLTVSLRHVDTRTGHVLVLQDGQELIVPQVLFKDVSFFTNCIEVERKKKDKKMILSQLA